MRRKRRPLIVLYARHFCERCDNRVFPYDKLEKRTVAPGMDIGEVSRSGLSDDALGLFT